MTPFGASMGGRVFPVAAHVFTVIGGILVILDSLVQIVESVVVPSSLQSIAPGSTVLKAAFVTIGLLLGVAIVALGYRLRSDPLDARRTGIWILVLGLVSYVGGAGFFVGLVLVVLGGILAMAWRGPTLEQMRLARQAYATPVGQPPDSLPPGYAPPLRSSARPGPRTCPACGAANLGDAPSCTRCGAPLS